jgi:salicylate biosynthesis isochorismate synthase/menaquinone-specific isochorismate synthase
VSQPSALVVPADPGLDDAARARLAERLEGAVRTARREGSHVLVAVTVAVRADLDLAGTVLAAREAGERFFCLEQPDRERLALCTLGEAVRIEASGPERFVTAAARCRAVATGALVDEPWADPDAPPGAGPVWVGGFAFDPEGGRSLEWESFAPAQLVLPEIALARRGGEARMTVAALVGPDDDPEAIAARLDARAGALVPRALPLLDPDPVVTPRVQGAAPPAHYEAAVARAVERITEGELEKVVLAREVRVHTARAVEAGPVFGALRDVFPGCYCYAVGVGEAALVGASPELLVRREGARAQTVALAGTTRRSADPAVDRHLAEALLASEKDRAEQAIVTNRIARRLAPLSLWVAPAEEPVVVAIQNVQHLATPIRAQLAEPLSAVELAGRLHPTPAVGGEPWSTAAPLIPALEGLDRGWYAGPVGWMDLAEDGEFCVALRCALVRGPVAHLYAGAGVVRDSIPGEELAETEVKLQALLPLLI